MGSGLKISGGKPFWGEYFPKAREVLRVLKVWLYKGGLKADFLTYYPNASKISTKGSIRFYVEEMRAIGDGMLKFVAKVDDTGNGIPKEVADTLLSHFNLRIRLRGRGLGLYISQKLAEMMGWRD